MSSTVVSLVEMYFVGHAQRGGACYLLSLEREIHRGCVMPVMTSTILHMGLK
ncbi:hypothetical protein U1Q18_039092, partial [Sarracenia purpurea var. burkii]